MTTFDFKNKYFAKIITKNLLKLFLLLLTLILATNVNDSNNATATKIITITTNTSKTALGGTAATLENFVWGHNTKYATIILDENIILKAATILDKKYPQNSDLNYDYTIIGIHSYAIDKLDFEIGKSLFGNIFVYLKEGGIGHNFTTVRYVSKASNDVEFNLKIFGVNV